MYFDNAATTFPKPDCVCTAVDYYMRCGAASLGRGSHRGSDEAAGMAMHCRTQLARLLGVASPSQVVFTLNCTDSLNTVLRGFLNPGDRVLASCLDHNSVLRPLQSLKEHSGIHFDLMGFDPTSGLLDFDDFARKLQQSPVRLVVLTHASNVTGRVQPIKELTQIAHSAGATVLLDAAQTAGHWPTSMADLDVDFLAAAGHKGLLGPLGTGILCMRKGLEEHLQPLRFGGTGTVSESLQQPSEMPSRFESGNMNLPGIAGLDAATRWILEQSVSKLHQKIEAHSRALLQGLSEISSVRLLTPLNVDSVGIVTFIMEGQDCRDVAMILDQSFDIQCRAGLHCAPLAHQTLGTFDQGGAVRLSPGAFTTDDQIQQVVEAVAAIAAAG
jgi:cysteine desulfurase / selenocysteine lyase